jgi:hypothetical protein
MLTFRQEFEGCLSLKVPTQDDSRKEKWTGLCYKVDDSKRASRINADVLEKWGFEQYGEINGFIEVVIRLGNSQDGQIHKLQILPVDHFEDCDILFGRDWTKRLRCITKLVASGLTKGKLKQHNFLGTQEDNGKSLV